MNIRGKWVVDEIASNLASRLLGSPFEVGPESWRSSIKNNCNESIGS